MNPSTSSLPSNSVEKFDYTHCRLLFKYKFNNYNYYFYDYLSRQHNIQNELMEEIKKIGFSTIEEYLVNRKNEFFNAVRMGFFEIQSFEIMYPGSYNSKTKKFNENVKPTNSTKKFDNKLCQKLFEYEWKKLGKLT